ncbi:MAG TPA: hypothetical protein VHF47_03225 [Acidimicrobiales bacterium]|nr:hypothetical protein [Acidimicrobiales bacterium]
MPCIFCIAVLVLVAGALTSEHLDEVEEKLRDKAEGEEVRRTVDTESVAKFELAVRVGSKSAPVAVTVFKDHRRVRIQVLTHDLTAEEVEELEDELAEALDAEVVDRSDPAHEAGEEHEAEPAADEEKERERVRERTRRAR